jgi:hypothetical protein
MHPDEHSHAANDSSFTIYRRYSRISENLASASSIALPPLNFSPALTGGLSFVPFVLRMIPAQARQAASASISL